MWFGSFSCQDQAAATTTTKISCWTIWSFQSTGHREVGNVSFEIQYIFLMVKKGCLKCCDRLKCSLCLSQWKDSQHHTVFDEQMQKICYKYVFFSSFSFQRKRNSRSCRIQSFFFFFLLLIKENKLWPIQPEKGIFTQFTICTNKYISSTTTTTTWTNKLRAPRKTLHEYLYFLFLFKKKKTNNKQTCWQLNGRSDVLHVFQAN